MRKILILLLALPLCALSQEEKTTRSIDVLGLSIAPAEKSNVKEWFGLSVGYVKKHWRWGKEEINVGGLEKESKFFSGVQAGIRVEPVLLYGFGIKTGVFYEYYYDYKQWPPSPEGVPCAVFSEAYEKALHIPLYLSYSLKVNKAAKISVFGGLGFDHSFKGRYYWKYHGKKPHDLLQEIRFYKRYKRNATSFDYGLSLRIWHIQADIWTAKGLNNVATFKESPKKCYRTLNISASYFF